MKVYLKDHPAHAGHWIYNHGYYNAWKFLNYEPELYTRIEDIVPMEVRNERNKILRLLSAKKRTAFDASFKGTEAKVLWESVNDEGKISGFTENYIKVQVPFDASLSNSITSVTV